MSDRFVVVPDGIRMRLAAIEVALLSHVPAALAELGPPESDPAAARLGPSAYVEDPEADAEWRRFTGPELDTARRADRSMFEVLLDRLSQARTEEITVPVAEAEAFLRVVNDMRLVLGARWHIEEPGDYASLRPEAEQTLGFLGWIVADLSGTLSARFDRTPGA